jgi:hypothetical protein
LKANEEIKRYNREMESIAVELDLNFNKSAELELDILSQLEIGEMSNIDREIELKTAIQHCDQKFHQLKEWYPIETTKLRLKPLLMKRANLIRNLADLKNNIKKRENMETEMRKLTFQSRKLNRHFELLRKHKELSEKNLSNSQDEFIKDLPSYRLVPNFIMLNLIKNEGDIFNFIHNASQVEKLFPHLLSQKPTTPVTAHYPDRFIKLPKKEPSPSLASATGPKTHFRSR